MKLCNVLIFMMKNFHQLAPSEEVAGAEKTKKIAGASKRRTNMDDGISVWAVMRAVPWRSISSTYNIKAPAEGEGQPQRFIPVFNLKEDAYKFAGKEDKHLVVEMKLETGEDKK